jgi:hypothetical protein
LNVDSSQIDLKLDPGEVNCSVWIDNELLNKALTYKDGDLLMTGLQADKMERIELKLGELFPYYPNDYFTGIGKSSAFALMHLHKIN